MSSVIFSDNLHRITVADFQKMEQVGILKPTARVELIEGVIVDMSPIGPTHNGIVDHLSQLLHRAIIDSGIVRTQGSIILDKYNEPEPDIAILRPKSDFYIKGLPSPGDILLVIEVADVSLREDRERKIPLYAKYDIPEVWLIDIANKSIEIYLEPSPSRYQKIICPEKPGIIKPSLLPNVDVDLSRLF
jgi:Uma2 family endonuclease